MKNRLISLSVALVAAFACISAQSTDSLASAKVTDSLASAQLSDSLTLSLNQQRLTQRLLRESGLLLGDASGVESDPPIVDGSYMRVGPEHSFATAGVNCSEYTTSPQTNKTLYSLSSYCLSPDFSYAYTVSKAGKVNQASDVVFNVYFSKSQYQIIRMTLDTHETAKSEKFTLNSSEVPDFTNTDFMSGFRNESTSDMDIFNGYVSTNTRRNEVFQGFVDINTLDYNGDGTDDIFLFLSNTLHVFDGSTLKEISSNKLLSYTNCSPASVVVDINGDGFDDYLSLVMSVGGCSSGYSKTLKGFYAVSSYSNDTLSYTFKQVSMNASDISLDKYTWRATLAMRLYYPEGKSNAAQLLFAVSEIAGSSGTVPARFYQTLTSARLTTGDIGVSADSKDWYQVVGCARDTVLFQYITSSGYAFGNLHNRRRPFLFGRPALATAFIDGYNEQQLVFWVSKVYKFNGSTNKFSVVYDIPNKHTQSNDKGFDRVVGGQVEAIKTADRVTEGREMFVFFLADSQNKDDIGTIYDDYDWKDTAYKLAGLWRNENTDDATWYIVAPHTYTEGSDGAMCLCLTPAYRGKGARLKLLRKDLGCSNPVISYVLAAPPYINGLTTNPGQISFTKDQSTSSSSSEATTWQIGGGGDFTAKFGSFFSVNIRGSVVHKWTDLIRQTIKSSESRSSGTQSGQDFVVFYYMPTDVFTYEVVECSEIPDIVGTQFKLTKVRNTGIMQKGMLVSDYNEMVKGTSCPQIGKDVLPHTVGDVSSYKHGAYKESEMRSAFDVEGSDFFRYSTAFDVPEETAVENVSLAYGEGESTEHSEATSVDVTVTFGFGKQEWKFGGDLFITGGWCGSWSMSKSWDNTYKIDARLPNIVNPHDNSYTYCLVWYRHHEKNSDGSDNQDYMVANWYVLEDNTATKMSLADILSKGKENDLYMVSDDLTAAYKNGDASILFAKDAGNYSPKQERGTMRDPYSNEDFDQSNWIRIEGPEGMASDITPSNALLPGGTIRGLYSSDEYGNPSLKIVTDKIQASKGKIYTGNNNVVANFALVQADSAKDVFLVTPKPFEYVQVKDAVLSDDKTTFYMPSSSTEANDYGLVGSAKIDWSMAGSLLDKITNTGEDNLYNFSAIVYRNAKKSNVRTTAPTPDGGWTIMPLEGGIFKDFPTRIRKTDVAGKVVARVRYYDLMGRECTQPANGLYIKVTTYADGSSKSEKIAR